MLDHGAESGELVTADDARLEVPGTDLSFNLIDCIFGFGDGNYAG